MEASMASMIEIAKFSGLYNIHNIVWINDIQKYLAMYLPKNDEKQIKIASKQLDGPTYEQFTWFYEKTKMVSINWPMFITNFLYRFPIIEDYYKDRRI